MLPLSNSTQRKHERIQTPLSSGSSSTSAFFASLSAPRAGLPRAMTRLLVVLALLGLGVFFVRSSRGGPEEGVWDASSYSDRRGSSPHSKGGLGVVKKRIERLRNPVYAEPAIPPPEDGRYSRPNLARQNYTLPKPTHPGLSRKAVIGAPDKYTTAPLPTIDEAWEWLHPRLREIKQKVPSIPREHQLWNPLFSSSLTEEMKLRFNHLRMDWDEEKGEWVPAEKRYLFVTICRQVAGESYSVCVILTRVLTGRHAR